MGMEVLPSSMVPCRLLRESSQSPSATLGIDHARKAIGKAMGNIGILPGNEWTMMTVSVEVEIG